MVSKAIKACGLYVRGHGFNPDFLKKKIWLYRALPMPLGGATSWPPRFPCVILSLVQKLTNHTMPYHHLKPNRSAPLVKMGLRLDQIDLA